jgi:tetratricopeptide (TPR) repeat protein
MHRARLPLVALVALVALGCAESSTPPPPAAPPQPAAPAAAASKSAPPIQFVEGDLPKATAQARAAGKALFIDVWAPWCHTCLSMQNYVLNDPSLRPLADRVVFASIDGDRPESAAFLERHTVRVWPTFFVLDPARDRVVGYWAGSGSVPEIRGLIEESLREIAGGAPDAASRAFAEARAAHAGGDPDRAAAAYERAVQAAAPSWPNRSAALLGWVQVLYNKKAWQECARVGQAHLKEISGASMPADASSYLLTCAENLPEGPARLETQKAAIARLTELTAHPPEGATVDDQADALNILAEGRTALKDPAGAREAQEKRLTLMDAAARAAATPEQAQTFDYGRANAYLALGRGDEAIRMLEQREREMPSSYEPPARLASVLFKTGKLPEALAAVDRALSRAYGPRRLLYVKLRADIQHKLGDSAGELAALREEVKGYEALPPGQASPERLANARKRLEEAEQKAAPRAEEPKKGELPKGKAASAAKAKPGKPAAGH